MNESFGKFLTNFHCALAIPEASNRSRRMRQSVLFMTGPSIGFQKRDVMIAAMAAGAEAVGDWLSDWF
jgi:hypothetical protein